MELQFCILLFAIFSSYFLPFFQHIFFLFVFYFSVPRYKQPECKDTQFRCDSDRCIPDIYVCDDYMDCADASDEDDQLCNPTSTKPTTTTTLPTAKATTKLSTITTVGVVTEEPKCNEFQFDCGYNAYRCIPISYVCDTYADCKDASDEADTICNPTMTLPTSRLTTTLPTTSAKTTSVIEEPKCKEFQFDCGYYDRCIPNVYVCDEYVDCKDTSDEDVFLCKPATQPTRPTAPPITQPQTQPTTQPTDQITTQPTTLPTTQSTTASIALLTDVSCEDIEFDCGGDQCIPLSNVCDGNDDCQNAADEASSICSDADTGKCYFYLSTICFRARYSLIGTMSLDKDVKTWLRAYAILTFPKESQ